MDSKLSPDQSYARGWDEGVRASAKVIYDAEQRVAKKPLKSLELAILRLIKGQKEER